MPEKNDSQIPEPEELKPQSATKPETKPEAIKSDGKKPDKSLKPKKRGSYRPSHKATFLALLVVIVILAINGAVIGFVLKKQDLGNQPANLGSVSINQAALAKLGVSQTPVKSAGLQLTVNPDAQFKGKVQIAGNTTIAGSLTLNNNFSASSASFSNLQAGKTQLGSVNVNGDGTISNLNLRKDLTVAGATDLQGQVTIASLLTASKINVAGNLSVGGSLAISNFRTGSLTIDRTLTIGGHIITKGSTPGVSRGAAVGTNGTVSISGNDASGTVFAGAASDAGRGLVACVTFRNAYSGVPNIVITQSSPLNAYVTRNAGGFCILVGDKMTHGGYFFSYIVEQ